MATEYTGILKSVKKLLGIEIEDTNFDSEIILDINSVLFKLNQLGVGPTEGYVVVDADQKWSDFIGSDRKDLESIKTYTYLKVKLLFDPPQSSYLIEAIKDQISELEWSINVQVENTL